MQADRLAAVADYFSVSTDYLLGRVETPNDILPIEDVLAIEDALRTSRILTYNGVVLTDEEKAETDKAIRDVLFKMAMEERRRNQ